MTAVDNRAERAKKDRQRREQKRVEEFRLIAKRASELVGESYHARFTAEDVEAMRTIVGRADPIRFAFDGEPGPADGRDGRDVLLAFASGELAKGDVAGAQVRAMTQRVRSDERAPVNGNGKYPSLWGRKPAALLLALAE